MDDNLEIRLNHVLHDIQSAVTEAGRTTGEVQLVAVSKTKPIEAIQEAYAAGQRHFGENKVQELDQKVPALPDDCVWHLIGHLQSNKVKQAVAHADLIHSVDSLKLAERIDRLAGEIGKSQAILLQVNVSGEASKSGFDPDSVRAVFQSIIALPHITCEGLMTMAPFDASSPELRACFERLHELREQLNTAYGTSLSHLSMGMSGDFKEAILEGATLVRIGTAIFGSR